MYTDNTETKNKKNIECRVVAKRKLSGLGCNLPHSRVGSSLFYLIIFLVYVDEYKFHNLKKIFRAGNLPINFVVVERFHAISSSCEPYNQCQC